MPATPSATGNAARASVAAQGTHRAPAEATDWTERWYDCSLLCKTEKIFSLWICDELSTVPVRVLGPLEIKVILFLIVPRYLPILNNVHNILVST